MFKHGVRKRGIQSGWETPVEKRKTGVKREGGGRQPLDPALFKAQSERLVLVRRLGGGGGL